MIFTFTFTFTFIYTLPYSTENTLIENGSPLRSALDFVQVLKNTKFDT